MNENIRMSVQGPPGCQARKDVAVVLASHVFAPGSGAASTHHMAYEMRIAKITAAQGQDF